MQTNCNGTFKIHTEIQEHKVNLFLYNMTVLALGSIEEGSPSKILGRDATLINTMRVGWSCEQLIYGEELGPMYEFDLSSGHRKLIDNSKVDLCNGTDSVDGDEVSEFLMSYLTNTLKRTAVVLEDKNPINYEKVQTKLLSNLRKNLNKPGVGSYDATFTLYKEIEITFEHRLTPTNDSVVLYIARGPQR